MADRLADGWPFGTGEMAGRIRVFDWSATPLGPIDRWSERLKLIVEHTLASPLVSSLMCGAERVLVYNDAAATLYGDRHPAALGRPLPETFPEGWATVAPLYERAFAGEAVQVAGQPLGTRGEGEAADVFDALLMPVRENDGRIAYVHMTGAEVGDRSGAEAASRGSEERQAFLLALGDALRSLSDPVAIQGAAMRVLGAHLKVSRAFYGDAEDDQDVLVIGAGYSDGTFPLEGQVRFSDFELDMAAWYRAGRTYVIEDAQRDTRFGETAKAGFAAIAVAAAVGVPLAKGGRVRAIVSLHQSAPRHWTATEIALLQETAERTWAAVERARAEAALRESEARYQALFAASPVPFMVLAANPPDFTIMAANKAYHAATLTTPETLLGRRLFDVFTDDPTRPGQLGSEALDISLERVMRTRQTDAMERVRYDIRTPEGGFEEHWWLAINAPLLDAAGDVTAIIHQVDRQTELHYAERALRESEEQQRLTLQLVPAMLWWADPTGHDIVINDQWRFYTGQGKAEVQNFGWLDAIHPDDVEATRAAFAHAFATGEPIERQQRIHQGDDGYRWHLVRHVPVRDAGGAIVRWFGAAIDVHDLHEMQGRQDVMVAELQHRTRNLIAVVRGVADDTMDETGPTEAFRDAFFDRLAALSRVQGLLSRSEAEPITIGALVALELDALGAGALGDRVTVAGPKMLLRPSTVQTLALALHELATNARKYGALSHEGGHLAVSWCERDEDGEPRLALDWAETGLEQAPDQPVSSSVGGGYGRELIEHALPHVTGARTSYALTPSGVRCTIDITVRSGARSGP